MVDQNKAYINDFEEHDFYLLMGEKQGVAADEPAELESLDEERIILAHTTEDLDDELVSSLVVRTNSTQVDAIDFQKKNEKANQ